MLVNKMIKERREYEVGGGYITVPRDEVMDRDHEAKWPDGFGVHGDEVAFGFDANTGKVFAVSKEGWPKGHTYSALWKVRDAGAYQLFDVNKYVIHQWNDCYVPAPFTFSRDEDSDYIEIEINGDGCLNIKRTFTADMLEEWMKD